MQNTIMLLIIISEGVADSTTSVNQTKHNITRVARGPFTLDRRSASNYMHALKREKTKTERGRYPPAD